MKPFFSIIIPTLNEEKFLPKLLECLQKQKFKNFEVILVDGKSEDKTIEKAREFEEKFNKSHETYKTYKIISSSKRNVSHQRNLGAKEAAGEYLVFFDADVAMGEDFLKKVFQHIKKEESLFLTTWIVPDSNEMVDELLILLTNYAIALAKYTKKAFLPGFNIIVERRTFFAIGGFDEKVKHAEDIYFAQRAKKKGISLHFLKEPTLTMSLRRFRSEGRLEVLQKYTRALTHILFKGPIKKELFFYPMGGSHHLNFKKKGFWERVKEKIKKLKTVEE